MSEYTAEEKLRRTLEGNINNKNSNKEQSDTTQKRPSLPKRIVRRPRKPDSAQSEKIIDSFIDDFEKKIEKSLSGEELAHTPKSTTKPKPKIKIRHSVKQNSLIPEEVTAPEPVVEEQAPEIPEPESFEDNPSGLTSFGHLPVHRGGESVAEIEEQVPAVEEADEPEEIEEVKEVPEEVEGLLAPPVKGERASLLERGLFQKNRGGESVAEIEEQAPAVEEADEPEEIEEVKEVPEEVEGLLAPPVKGERASLLERGVFQKNSEGEPEPVIEEQEDEEYEEENHSLLNPDNDNNSSQENELPDIPLIEDDNNEEEENLPEIPVINLEDDNEEIDSGLDNFSPDVVVSVDAKIPEPEPYIDPESQAVPVSVSMPESTKTAEDKLMADIAEAMTGDPLTLSGRENLEPYNLPENFLSSSENPERQSAEDKLRANIAQAISETRRDNLIEPSNFDEQPLPEPEPEPEPPSLPVTDNDQKPETEVQSGFEEFPVPEPEPELAPEENSEEESQEQEQEQEQAPAVEEADEPEEVEDVKEVTEEVEGLLAPPVKGERASLLARGLFQENSEDEPEFQDKENSPDEPKAPEIFDLNNESYEPEKEEIKEEVPVQEEQEPEEQDNSSFFDSDFSLASDFNQTEINHEEEQIENNMPEQSLLNDETESTMPQPSVQEAPEAHDEDFGDDWDISSLGALSEATSIPDYEEHEHEEFPGQETHHEEFKPDFMTSPAVNRGEELEKEKVMGIREKIAAKKSGAAKEKDSNKIKSSSGMGGALSTVLMILLLAVGGLILWQLMQLNDTLTANLMNLSGGSFTPLTQNESKPSYEYSVDFILDNNWNERMTQRGREGWQVVGSRRTQDSVTGALGYEIIFMRRTGK